MLPLAQPATPAQHRLLYTGPMLKRLLLALSLSLPALGAVAQAASSTAPPTARVIVKFKADAVALRARALGAGADAKTVADTLADRASVLSARTGLALKAVVAVGERTQVVTASGMAGPALAARLATDPDVEYAEVDQRMHRRSAPNDPLYATGSAMGPTSGQWYLKPSSATTLASVNAEQAWDMSKGSGVVVAVLDTGVRRDHPDLSVKLLAGYDMVSDVDTANDGNGRDADPSDPGDWVTTTEVNQVNGPFYQCTEVNDDGTYTGENSSWHGTQVAGIVGAITDNGQGMAGTGWNVRVLPVRVLGKCGGFVSDIAIGMRWAAGLHVDGVPDIPIGDRAKVINLSLGGTGSCGPTYQAAVNEVVAAGVVVVAAAGNSNGKAVGQPADCAGVIGVTGVRHIGTKVGFADVGPEIAIAAPGGNCVTVSGACQYPILSATNTGVKGPAASSYTDSFDAGVGTSFSSPIVAGTVALMMSSNPELTPAQVRAALQSTAQPFPSTGADPGVAACHAPDGTVQNECYCTTTTCGAGLLDARAAVAAVAQLHAYVTGVGSSLAPTSATVGDSVKLAASGSTTASGTPITGYQWQIIDGAGLAALADDKTAAPTLAVSGAGAVTVRLTVTDAAGTTASSDQIVNVAAAPGGGGGSGSGGSGGGGSGGSETTGGGGGGAASPLWLALLGLATLSLNRRRSRSH